MRRLRENIAFSLRWVWLLRLLDRAAPRPGIGGPSKRYEVITDPTVARRIQEILDSKDRS